MIYARVVGANCATPSEVEQDGSSIREASATKPVRQTARNVAPSWFSNAEMMREEKSLRCASLSVASGL
jgi:hypothetical protein